MLAAVVAGIASGARTMRQVEEFVEDLPGRARKALGLLGEVSDTALYKLVEAQDPTGFADVVERQVKAGLRSKAIQNDVFPHGVMAIDGKSNWTGNHAATYAQRCARDDGTPYWMQFSQRAVLVSSSAAPCVFQQFIPDKTNEMACFESCFAEVNARFGKSFEFVTSDAGACSRHNASVVHEAGKAYLFALKENQPSLLMTARCSLGAKETPGDSGLVSEVRTVERYRGKTVTRDLFRVKAEDAAEEVNMPGARELWRVRQHSLDANGKQTTEDRYFITNRRLGAQLALRLVRLHWGIENGANWTLDVILGEDASTPCTQGHGLAVSSWLRQLAYNLLALWRTKQKAKHGEPLTWRRTAELLKQAFGRYADLAAQEAPATLR